MKDPAEAIIERPWLVAILRFLLKHPESSSSLVFKLGNSTSINRRLVELQHELHWVKKIRVVEGIRVYYQLTPSGRKVAEVLEQAVQVVGEVLHE